MAICTVPPEADAQIHTLLTTFDPLRRERLLAGGYQVEDRPVMMCSIRSLIGPLPNFTLPDGFIRGTNEADMAQIADVHNGAFGVILVATFVGVANFVISRIFQVPNAVMLGFIMGITTILPLIGGYLGAGLSTLLALLSAPVYALIAFGSFVAVQQIENHILTPRVMCAVSA